MKVKFTASHMKEYQGVDGLGGMLTLKAGDEAEVSETVGQLLLQKYHRNFEVVIEEKPAHLPQADKALRKGPKTKSK